MFINFFLLLLAEISHQLKETKAKVIFTVVQAKESCIAAVNLLKINIPIVIVKSHPENEIPQGTRAIKIFFFSFLISFFIRSFLGKKKL